MGLKPRQFADGACWPALPLYTSEALPGAQTCSVCVFCPKSELSGVGQLKVSKRNEEVGEEVGLFTEIKTITLVVSLVRVKVEVSQTG